MQSVLNDLASRHSGQCGVDVFENDRFLIKTQILNCLDARSYRVPLG